jgi:hypothetical protein
MAVTCLLAECVVAGGHKMEVATLRITEAGRKALANDPAGG